VGAALFVRTASSNYSKKKRVKPEGSQKRGEGGVKAYNDWDQKNNRYWGWGGGGKENQGGKKEKPRTHWESF